MKYRDPDDTDPDNPEIPRLSAIERQIAAAAAARIDDGDHAHQNYQPYRESAEPAMGRRYNYRRHHRRRRFGAMSFFVIALFVAIGVAFAFLEFGRSPQTTAGTVLRAAEPAASLPAASPVDGSGTVAAPESAGAANSATVPVPVTDISLRSRPELLEQLVQLYRAQIAANPADSTASTALDRLQEKSLSELEIIMAGDDDAVSLKAFDTLSRLFPELTDDARYRSLALRRDQIQLAAVISSRTGSPAKEVSPPSGAPAKTAKQPAANTAPTEPQIHVVSITPGSMKERRFVPADEGNAFMVQISYRNFRKSDAVSDATLVALFGMPGDSAVLAEVPIEIPGDRGTKNFLVETLVPGRIGEKYRLNFLLDDELLASSTVRVSAPAR